MVLLLPFVLLLTAEGILRIAGYGAPTDFFIRAKSGDAYFANEKFAWQFFVKRTTSKPVFSKLSLRKEPNTLRVFVLGESAAMGTPDPAFSFGRILQLFLERQYPEKKIELINAAMRGIDSHVVRRIAQDCARHEPDLFVLYMGNNEVIGLHGPEPGGSRLSQWPPLIRAAQVLKSSRLGQLAKNAFQKSETPERQDMEYFRSKRLRADDPLRELVYKNFRSNLRDIVSATKAPVILSTVPVNLKDFPPLASLHRGGLTDAQLAEWSAAFQRGDYSTALRIDDHFAELHFRMGQSPATTNAPHHFQLARDWDALQFRTDSRLNDIIREAGAGARLVDAERRLVEADGGIPGARMFRDHVHPSFMGDFILANALLPEVLAALEGRPATLRNQPGIEEVAGALGYTVWHEAQAASAMADLSSRAPFHDQLDYAQRQAVAESSARQRLAQLGQTELQQSLDAVRKAINGRPDDWMLRFNYAFMCQAMGQPSLAIEPLQSLVKLFPESATFRIQLARALAQAGRADAAAFEFQEAAKLDPMHPQLPPK